MKRARNAFVVLALAALGLGADGGTPPSGTAVVRIGTNETTIVAYETKLGEIPGFQLEMLGKTELEAKHRVLEDVFVRDTLLVASAESQGLLAREPTLTHLRRVRANAALRHARDGVPTAGSIPKDELLKYFEANRVRFESPERIAVARILVATEAEARAVIATFKADATYTAWEKLARDKSLDKATSMRGGNLGFLAFDGTSNEAGVRAPPELPRAAVKVQDGEIVPTPVKEGDAWAVVWRRGRRAPVKQTFEQAEPEIRELVRRATSERAAKELIERLRKGRVSEIDETALALVEVPAADAVLREPKR